MVKFTTYLVDLPMIKIQESLVKLTKLFYIFINFVAEPISNMVNIFLIPELLSLVNFTTYLYNSKMILQKVIRPAVIFLSFIQ